MWLSFSITILLVRFLPIPIGPSNTLYKWIAPPSYDIIDNPILFPAKYFTSNSWEPISSIDPCLI